MKESYDEDLEKNPFFESLRNLTPNLFRRALNEKLYIFVPKRDSLKGVLNEDLSRIFERHIVRLEETTDGDVSYWNLDGDPIEPSNDGQTLTLYISNNEGGCRQAISVSVLFEETYFTDDGANCKLLCISRPFVPFYDDYEKPSRSNFCIDLSTATTSSSVSSPVSSLSSVSACSPSSDPFECYQNWLFADDYGNILQKQLRRSISRFVERITNEYRSSWHCEQLKILVKEEFYTTLKDVLTQKRQAVEKLDGADVSRLQIATEVYFFRCVHSRLTSLLCACLRDEESAMNKMKYAVSDLRPADWGIASELYGNLPTARRQLSKLDELDTPYGKLQCLRKSIATLTENINHGGRRAPLSTDDLIPPLAFLIAKSSIFDWATNIMYMSEFHFSAFANDELSYCLACFEAAAQYIREGTMKPMVVAKWRDWALGKTESCAADGVGRRDVLHAEDHVMDDDDTTDSDYWEAMTAALQSGDEAAVKDCMNGRIVMDACDGIEGVQINDVQENNIDIDVPGNLVNGVGRKSIYWMTPQRLTALHFAALFGQTSVLHYLIKCGADCLLDNEDECGRTPLHWACRVGSQSCTLLLLHHGAKSNRIDQAGDSPLHCAAYYGHVDCVKALLYFNQQVRGYSAGINLINHAGEAPLHIAVRFHHVDIVSVLLECGANSKLPDSRGRTAFELCGDFESRRLLSLVTPYTEVIALDIDANQSAASSPQRHISVQNRAKVSGFTLDNMVVTVSSALVDLNIDKIDKMLKAVADNDLPLVRHYLGDRDGGMRFSSRCHPLCQCPKCEELDESIDEGVNVNATGSNGLNAAHTAVLSDRIEILRYLIESCGADVNWPSAADGRTCLHLAAIKENAQTLTLLLEHNADINARDSAGDTPLQLAASAGNTLLQSLVDKKHSKYEEH